MYELFSELGDSAAEDCFVLLEWWADAAALKEHMKAPHIEQGHRNSGHCSRKNVFPRKALGLSG